MRPAHPQHSSFPPDHWVFGVALASVAAAYLTISPLLLGMVGVNYEASGGNVLEKVHPGTLLAGATLALAALSLRNPLAEGAIALRESPGIVAYLAMTIATMAHAALVSQQPFTPLIDTFIAPVIVFALFSGLSAGRARRLGYLIHLLIATNSLIGVAEFAFGFRLTPFTVAGMDVLDDWRSSALLGHPLANASLTGAYLLALACGAGRALPPLVTPALFLISSAGMIVFGGRAATVILIAMLAIIAIINAVRALAEARFSTQKLLIALCAVPIAALAILWLAEAGVFDRFLSRFVDDAGSADARIEMFDLLRFVSWTDLMLGPDPAVIETLKRMHGLYFGIESFWLSFVFTYGLIVSIPFFIALFNFCATIARASGEGAAAILVFFFLVGSTSVSLSAKTPIFAALTMMILTLLHPALVARARSSRLTEVRGMARTARG